MGVLKLRATPLVLRYLDEMRATGLHGDTIEDVADELIRAGIRAYVARESVAPGRPRRRKG